MTSRRLENGQTLASVLRIDLEQAVARLDVRIVVTADPADVSAQRVAKHLQDMLGRTVSQVDSVAGGTTYAAEIVVGCAQAHTQHAIRVFVDKHVVSIGPAASASPIESDIHGLSLLLAACYGSAAALRAALGGLSALPGPPPDETSVVPLDVFYGTDRDWMTARIELADTYLAGAGAIGNGVLCALQCLPVAGELHIVDDDIVSDGNLNRCVWFDSRDIGKSKAERLGTLAQPSFRDLKLIPLNMTLQDVKKTKADRAWLNRLIVGIDTRRGRRRLQNEVPGEVFDASTTGVEEVVLHHHKQPTEEACLACIYHESSDELSRERHVAETLGVTLAQVQEPGGVSAAAANDIAAKYTQFRPADLVGQAYDSLFKNLCSEMAIRAPDGQHVLAPFCFVSVLAGTCLVIELGRRLHRGSAAPDFNYWCLSPWAPPVQELKQLRGRDPACTFCSKESHRAFAEKLWQQRPGR